jgi:acyl-CoA reductase-like NAD-dependent aldehyde dehydrogenase
MIVFIFQRAGLLQNMEKHVVNVLCCVCFSIADGNVFCYTRHEPVGVVGAITPVCQVAFVMDRCFVMI